MNTTKKKFNDQISFLNIVISRGNFILKTRKRLFLPIDLFNNWISSLNYYSRRSAKYLYTEAFKFSFNPKRSYSRNFLRLGNKWSQREPNLANRMDLPTTRIFNHIKISFAKDICELVRCPGERWFLSVALQVWCPDFPYQYYRNKKKIQVDSNSISVLVRKLSSYLRNIWVKSHKSAQSKWKTLNLNFAICYLIT